MSAFRQRLKDWFRNAFAIPAESQFVATEPERVVAERVCRLIVDRGLIVPALIFLESSRPLSYIASQSMYFFTPFVAALADPVAYEHFARLLARTGSVEFLCRMLETMKETKGAVRNEPKPSQE